MKKVLLEHYLEEILLKTIELNKSEDLLNDKMDDIIQSHVDRCKVPKRSKKNGKKKN